MNQKNFGVRAIAVLLSAACVVAALALRASAQQESWQVIRADYGWRQQRTDVTGLLRDLLSRGGVNGRVAVNNQTMGGDPAVGRDKILRVFARNFRGEEREFDFLEGGFLDVAMFQNLPARDSDDHPRDNDRHQDRDDRFQGAEHDREGNALQILYAFYGIQHRTVNVTDVLRARTREGSIFLHVSNDMMGFDPAVGADKVLIVVYRFEGKEQAVAVAEDYNLTLP
jgi:hypothetical protein